MTRVLVIGAGHNGLVAAIHLAAAGCDVTVLEHAPRPGGATSSVQLHAAGLRPRPLRRLRADDRCVAGDARARARARRPRLGEPGGRRRAPVPGRLGDRPAPGRQGDGRLARGRREPAGRRRWTSSCRVATPLVESVLGRLPRVRPAARVALSLRRDGLEWARRLAGSVQALGLDLFEGDRRATAWLAASAQHSGLPPTAAGSGAFGLLLQVLGHSHGWPFPRGGMRLARRRARARAPRARGPRSAARPRPRRSSSAAAGWPARGWPAARS